MARQSLPPTFLSPVRRPVEILGTKLVLRPASSIMAFRLRGLAGLAYATVDAFVSGKADARQRAVAELFEELGRDAQLVGALVLDALREDGPAAQPPPKEVDAFLAGTDASVLGILLSEVVAVNSEDLRPLGERLLAQLTEAVGAVNSRIDAAVGTKSDSGAT